MSCSQVEFDMEAGSGFNGIVGIDEAGRGALAGPVVASAVCLSRDCYGSQQCLLASSQVDDSKKLTIGQRENVFEKLCLLKASGSIRIEIGVASVEEIEEVNILGATRLAMARALDRLAVGSSEISESEATPDGGHLLLDCYDGNGKSCRGFGRRKNHRVLVDGKPLRPFPYEHTAIVKGDGKSLAIGMASIVAKVVRDRIMCGLHGLYPCYSFSQHKGYGTDLHRRAIRDRGPSRHHRRKFLRRLLEPELVWRQEKIDDS